MKPHELAATEAAFAKAWNAMDEDDLTEAAGGVSLIRNTGPTEDRERYLRAWQDGEPAEPGTTTSTPVAMPGPGQAEPLPPLAPQPKEEPTFGQAFRRARQAGDKLFTWRGKSYTTKLKTEAPTSREPNQDKRKQDARRTPPPVQPGTEDYSHEHRRQPGSASVAADTPPARRENAAGLVEAARHRGADPRPSPGPQRPDRGDPQPAPSPAPTASPRRAQTLPAKPKVPGQADAETRAARAQRMRDWGPDGAAWQARKAELERDPQEGGAMHRFKEWFFHGR